MIRSKLGLLVLCAIVLGGMAMSASSAQAALSWLVLNAAHTQSFLLNAAVRIEDDSNHLTLRGEIIGLQVNFTCTNEELINASIGVEDTLMNGGKIKYTGCEAYEGFGPLGTALGCNVKTAGAQVGTIVTNALKGLLILHTLAGGGSEVIAKIEPQEAGGNLASIETSGCALPETNPIRGTVTLKDCLGEATTHRERHLLELAPLTALYFGAHSVKKLETTKILGSAWVELAGAHDGLLFGVKDL